MRPALLILALGLAGCVVAPVALPYPSPPPPQAEVMPKPPVSEAALIWQPGHWDWTGSAYAWTPGAWVPRDGHGQLWQDGSWSNQTGIWQWMPAHWV